MKNMSKSHTVTPLYDFKIGDLVLFRNANDENNPRDLYIVKDFAEVCTHRKNQQPAPKQTLPASTLQTDCSSK